MSSKKISDKFHDQNLLSWRAIWLTNLETGREHIIDVLAYLKKNDPALQFIYLTDITGIHYPEQEKQ